MRDLTLGKVGERLSFPFWRIGGILKGALGDGAGTSGVESAISLRNDGDRLWFGCGEGEIGGKEREGGDTGVTDPEAGPARRLDGGCNEVEAETRDDSSIDGCNIMSSCLRLRET